MCIKCVLLFALLFSSSGFLVDFCYCGVHYKQIFFKVETVTHGCNNTISFVTDISTFASLHWRLPWYYNMSIWYNSSLLQFNLLFSSSVIYPPQCKAYTPRDLQPKWPWVRYLKRENGLLARTLDTQESPWNVWSVKCQGHRQRQHRTEYRQRTHTQSQD